MCKICIKPMCHYSSKQCWAWFPAKCVLGAESGVWYKLVGREEEMCGWEIQDILDGSSALLGGETSVRASNTSVRASNTRVFHVLPLWKHDRDLQRSRGDRFSLVLLNFWDFQALFSALEQNTLAEVVLEGDASGYQGCFKIFIAGWTGFLH